MKESNVTEHNETNKIETTNESIKGWDNPKITQEEPKVNRQLIQVNVDAKIFLIYNLNIILMSLF
jgi:hypothetical protein